MAIYICGGLLLLFQGVAGAASVVDASQGNFDDHQISYPYANDLTSVQNAVTRAYQLAQQYHAGRLIVLANTNPRANGQMLKCIQAPHNVLCQNSNWYDRSTRSVFQYFTDQLPMASTVVDDTCLLLPGPSTGPVVVLVPPYESVIDAFFAANYIHVVQSETSKRLAGAPFHLYVVDPLPVATPQTTFSSNIQLVNAQAEQLQGETFAAVRWNVLQSAPASDRTTYMYEFTYAGSKQGVQLPPQTCTLTNRHAGDQLVTLLPYGNVQGPLSVQVEQASTAPYTITFKSIPFLPAFDTFQQDVNPFEPLKTPDGHQKVTIQTFLEKK
jgi:hypothetical protein